MKATLKHHSGEFTIDFSKPLDISIHTDDSSACAKAWYVDHMKIVPVMTDQFKGSVKDGGTVNFRDIFFNPHGNTTHTECVGHISEEVYNLQNTLKKFFFKAQVITVLPEVFEGSEEAFRKHGDQIIFWKQIEELLSPSVEAVIIRTLPNSDQKKQMQWSGSNWPYFDEEVGAKLAEMGIKHLLTDLPSVDRELDGGKMLVHRSFWNYPQNTRFDATISEMIYASDTVPDGFYFLNLQPASFVNDASPCKPVLYAIEN